MGYHRASKRKAVIGDWNALCDQCGFKYKASELRDRWDGLKVCQPCWEPRHPSDHPVLPRGIAVPSWTRPVPTTTYVSGHCQTRVAIPSLAIPGCAIPNYTTFSAVIF